MKETGILLAVSSLPSAWGAGDLGDAALEWIDLLEANGVSIWQILPLNPTGYGNSPYQPYSSFAGDELYLSLEQFFREGLLENLPEPFQQDCTRVAYDQVRAWKETWLREACKKFQPDSGYQDFIAQEWVRDYAVFRAFKKANGGACWTEWPAAQRDWPQNPVEPKEFLDEIAYHLFLQYQFTRQWERVKTYAAKHGVRIMGDVPFYVGLDSVDVWAGRDNFLLDKDGNPAFIAGVPPDYFSATGQRWGNPIYDWEHLEKNGFSFWIDRIGYNQKLFDIIRIDHFRAFDTFWKIPASCPTAVEGAWIEAPGYEVIETLQKSIPNLCLAAEDLGDLRPEVTVLKDHFHLPGMKVLEFTINFQHARAYDEAAELEHVIAYTGTHDNATLLEWYRSLPAAHRRKLRKWLKREGFCNGSVPRRMIEYTLADRAETAIIPASDFLELPASARMNMPGTVGSPNWEWRLTSFTPLRAALKHYRPLIQNRKTKAETLPG